MEVYFTAESRDEHTCVSPPHKLRMEQRQRGRLSDRFSKVSIRLKQLV